MNQANPCSRNSPNANKSSTVQPSSWITFVRLEIPQSSMATWSTRIAIRQARQHQNFGSYRPQLYPNYGTCAILISSLLLFIRIRMVKVSKHFHQIWSLVAGLSPPSMSPTQTLVTRSQVSVGSFLASICPVRPALHHFCSNTHLPFPHVLLPDSYGNLLIDLSTQFHWPAMTHTLPIKTAPRWHLHCLNQPHTLPALSCWNIISTMLAPMKPYSLVRTWYQLMAFALHSMPVQI